MRYIIDGSNLSGFIQFAAFPQSGDTWVYPSVAQFRGGVTLLIRIEDILLKAQSRMSLLEATFHETEASRQAFESGDVIFSPGDPLLIASMRSRSLALFANGSVLLSEIKDPGVLLKAVRAAIRKMQ